MLLLKRPTMLVCWRQWLVMHPSYRQAAADADDVLSKVTSGSESERRPSSEAIRLFSPSHLSLLQTHHLHPRRRCQSRYVDGRLDHSVGCAWRQRRIHHPWWGCWLGRLLLQLCKGGCWWPWHTQWDKVWSSRYNDDGWRWCFFWKHTYDCTLVTMKIRLKATLNRRVNSLHCTLIDKQPRRVNRQVCAALTERAHWNKFNSATKIYARCTKYFSCVHDLTCRSHCYMFVPLSVVIWPLTFAFSGPTAWNSTWHHTKRWIH